MFLVYRCALIGEVIVIGVNFRYDVVEKVVYTYVSSRLSFIFCEGL